MLGELSYCGGKIKSVSWTVSGPWALCLTPLVPTMTGIGGDSSGCGGGREREGRDYIHVVICICFFAYDVHYSIPNGQKILVIGLKVVECRGTKEKW